MQQIVPAQVPTTVRALAGDLVERRPVLAALALVLLTIATHALIVAAPGFYANDEWQKFDHVRLHGMKDFVTAYGALRPGPEFGYPVRPIGFMQQGVAALWMQSAPWASHLVGVFNHALVALTFVWVLRRAGFAVATAAVAGVFFVLSPLTTMATGWLAASFDQLYILFLLFAAAALVRLPAERVSPLCAAFLVLATSAALLAKETAIVAPGLALLLGYLKWCANPKGFSWRPYGVAFAVMLLPVITYMLFRAPAILASMAGQSTAEYTPALSYMPENAWRFFSFPFRPKIVELSANVFRSPWQPMLAATIHLALIGAVFRYFGARYVLAYFAGYFLFLLPVLTLPNPGAQCLYGAALAMSLAMAAVTMRALDTRRRGAVLLIAAAGIGLLAHGLVIQRHLYEQGQCQAHFLAGVDALLAQPPAATTPRLVVVPERGAPARVGIRAVAAREAYTAKGSPVVTFADPDQPGAVPPDAGTQRARMTPACFLK